MFNKGFGKVEIIKVIRRTSQFRGIGIPNYL